MIFENIFQVADHQHKDTEVVNIFTETAVSVDTPIKKQLHLWKKRFMVHRQNIIRLLDIQTRFLIFPYIQ